MDLTKLKELAERATPGPWSAVWEEGDDTAWPNLFPVIQDENGETVIGNEGFYSDLEQDKANAQFCAAANPQAILGLIAEVERLRESLDDCTNYLLAEVLQKYSGQLPDDMHPVTRRDYDRDMAEVAEFRAALEGGGR